MLLSKRDLANKAYSFLLSYFCRSIVDRTRTRHLEVLIWHFYPKKILNPQQSAFSFFLLFTLYKMLYNIKVNICFIFYVILHRLHNFSLITGYFVIKKIFFVNKKGRTFRSHMHSSKTMSSFMCKEPTIVWKLK